MRVAATEVALQRIDVAVGVVDVFAWWRAIWDPRCVLDTSTRGVMSTLLRYVRPESAEVWPALSTIADGAGLSKRKAILAVDELERRGCFGRERRRRPGSACHTSTLYTIRATPPLDALHEGGAPDAPRVVHAVHEGGAPDAPDLLQRTSQVEQSARAKVRCPSDLLETLRLDGTIERIAREFGARRRDVEAAISDEVEYRRAQPDELRTMAGWRQRARSRVRDLNRKGQLAGLAGEPQRPANVLLPDPEPVEVYQGAGESFAKLQSSLRPLAAIAGGRR